jgi:catechol 2,3-dioxygenase-like lactoylglutathione lyase family enzyme
VSPALALRSKLSHVDLVVTSIERSLAFYRGLLEPIGWTNLNEVSGERGETIWYAVFFHDPDGIKLELLHRPTYWNSL